MLGVGITYMPKLDPCHLLKESLKVNGKDKFATPKSWRI